MDAANNIANTATLPVPGHRIVSIQHPCIINDIDRGLETLGGVRHVEQILNHDNAVPLATSLRAGDSLARKLLSHKADVNHLLLRVVLPKRTGRKRKRGSDDPFEYQDDEPEETPEKAPEVLTRLKAAGDDVSVDVLGSIRSNHRFRSLPDFQLLDQDNHVMQRVSQQLIEPTLAKIKAFDVNMQDQSPPGTLLGPPQFVHYSQQLYYGYAQARGTTTHTGPDGRIVSGNTMLPPRRARTGLPADIVDLPTSPPPSLPPLETTDEALQETVASLQVLLSTRPIITRRVAMNLCGDRPLSLMSTAMQYTGYLFRSGPWKDTLVRFGLDPRLSSDNRIYQTLSFQLTPKDKIFAAARRLPQGGNKWLRAAPSASMSDPTASHLFCGTDLGSTRTWQLLDLTDPVLARIVADAPYRQAPPELDQTGYYYPATTALLRAIMRDKIALLLGEQSGDRWDAVYARVAEVAKPDLDPLRWKVNWSGLSVEEKQKAGEILAVVRAMLKVDAAGKTKAVADEDEGEDDGGMADLDALDREGLADGEEE